MRTRIAVLAIVASLAVPSIAGAHGNVINLSWWGGGAYPLGSELTKMTATSVDQCNSNPPSAICNPAYFGAGGGLGLDYQFPFHFGIGLGFTYHAFLREEKPKPNLDSTQPFMDVQFFVPSLSLRVLDMAPGYKKKWGTLIFETALAFGQMYQVWHIGIKAGLSYLYPVVKDFQIGLYFDYVFQHPFKGGYGNDSYLAFGLKMSYGFLKPKPWGRKKTLGEEEEQVATQATDDMKKQDSDQDGLNDYCEMMMGTSSTSSDSDQDGLFDAEEDKNKNCMRDEGETDPVVADTDGGGAPDGWEVKAGYDPLNPDDDDKDQDFVSDDNDNCPGTPRGLAVNERGCPTIVEKTLLEGVKFYDGQAELTPEGAEALGQWVAVLMDNPEMKFEILVYTDNKGKPKKLLDLTDERARTVFDFFASKGISEARMTAKGMGSADPVADNKTPDGRDANNRVEIVPLFEGAEPPPAGE